jgi:hypothetical protein
MKGLEQLKLQSTTIQLERITTGGSTNSSDCTHINETAGNESNIYNRMISMKDKIRNKVRREQLDTINVHLLKEHFFTLDNQVQELSTLV